MDKVKNVRDAGTSQKTKTIPKETIFKFLASLMFCVQYMISRDIIFSMDIIDSFKQKKFEVWEMLTLADKGEEGSGANPFWLT